MLNRFSAPRRSSRPVYQAAAFVTPLYRGLRALGVPAINRRLQDAGLVLCYHNVVPSNAASAGDPGIHMAVERFEWQMRWLAAHYSVVDLTEFVDRVAA